MVSTGTTPFPKIPITFDSIEDIDRFFNAHKRRKEINYRLQNLFLWSVKDYNWPGLKKLKKMRSLFTFLHMSGLTIVPLLIVFSYLIYDWNLSSLFWIPVISSFLILFLTLAIYINWKSKIKENQFSVNYKDHTIEVKNNNYNFANLSFSIKENKWGHRAVIVKSNTDMKKTIGLFNDEEMATHYIKMLTALME